MHSGTAPSVFADSGGGTDPLSHVVLDNIMEGVHKANEDHEEITAANNLKTYGTWDLLEVRDIDQLENEIKKRFGL